MRKKALSLFDSGKSRLEIQAELGIDINQYYKIKQRYFAGGHTNALWKNYLVVVSHPK
jgi:putative transposase